MNDLTIRFAKEDDLQLIFTFIKELANYEQLLDEVVATEEILHNSLFVQKAAEVILCEYEGEPVGFALFFHNFSTFLGKTGLYLEDLYVKPEMRGRGFGKQILAYLANLAIERDCSRFEWWCLDWNQSSINFYKKLGAMPMSEWTVYRLTTEEIKELANFHSF